VTALPKATQQRTEWQKTAEMLVMAAGQRPLMFADMAMRQALHADKPAPTRQPRRKPARKYRIVRQSARRAPICRCHRALHQAKERPQHQQRTNSGTRRSTSMRESPI